MPEVNSVLIEKLFIKIERYLRTGAEYILLVTNYAHSNTFDLGSSWVCNSLSKGNQKVNATNCLLFRHMLPCFGEPQDLGSRIIHADTKPTATLDDCELCGVVEFAMDVGL